MRGSGTIRAERAGVGHCGGRAERLYASAGFPAELLALIDPARLVGADADAGEALLPRPDPHGPRGLAIEGITLPDGRGILLVMRHWPSRAAAGSHIACHALALPFGTEAAVRLPLSRLVEAIDAAHLSGDHATATRPVEVDLSADKAAAANRGLDLRLTHALAKGGALVLMPDVCATEVAFLDALARAIETAPSESLARLKAQSGFARRLPGYTIEHVPAGRAATACVRAFPSPRQKPRRAAPGDDSSYASTVVALPNRRTPETTRPTTKPTAVRLDITRSVGMLAVLAARESPERGVASALDWIIAHAAPAYAADWDHLAALPTWSRHTPLLGAFRRALGHTIAGDPSALAFGDIDLVLRAARVAAGTGLARRHVDGLLTTASEALLRLLSPRTYLTPAELAQIRELPEVTLALAELARDEGRSARRLFAATGTILAHQISSSGGQPSLQAWAERARLTIAPGGDRIEACIGALEAVIADPSCLGIEAARDIIATLSAELHHQGAADRVAALARRPHLAPELRSALGG